MSESLALLHEQGQSTWLDFISRGFLDSGELQRLIDDEWVSGLTSNPTIFGKAIAGSPDYDEELRALAEAGVSDPYDAFVRLAGADLRRAADALRPIYEAGGGADGYVSFELPPGVEHDSQRSITEARRLVEAVGRPNVMVKVPGTPNAPETVERLIGEGVNVNITLLFDIAVYEAVARAYVAGLERALEAGRDLSAIASVASFFVSRVDTQVDARLPEDSPLRGTAGIANARAAYARFAEVFSGAVWDGLAAAGARVQRPLWASTGTKNAAYSDVLYVDNLVAPDTVNTLPEATLNAFADHGDASHAITREDEAEAEATLAALGAAGVDLKALTDQLLLEGLDAFEADFLALLRCIDEALTAIRSGSARSEGNLGPIADAAGEALDRLAREDVAGRLQAGDHTLWAADPAGISNRLGWLTAPEDFAGRAGEIEAFAGEAVAAGLDDVVLLGMGGSSLAAEVIASAHGGAPGHPVLTVLDTTDPAEVRALDARLDRSRTLFVVASKSGTTVETRSQLDYFWSRVPDGAHFVAITDPDTPLAALAGERGFRRVFLNPPEIGGRYSALSYFGLVPAALIGVDPRGLLAPAVELQRACGACAPPGDNPGVRLGAVLGAAAAAGRDKLTLVLPPPLAALGSWIEQLVAESTGKDGRGIVPVEGEPLGPPEVYGDDRLFLAYGDHEGLAVLDRAGHPVVRLPAADAGGLGAEFYRWEVATAVAGCLLGVQPFDEPSVQQAKDATARILGGTRAAEAPATPGAAELLAGLRPGDYVALQAFLPRDTANVEALQAARVRLRDRHRVAVTAGFGPRFLHSTGQLHKGGPDSVACIQIVSDTAVPGRAVREGDGDLAIPGRTAGFGELQRAQALGDLESLLAIGRRVARVTLGELAELRA